MTISGSGFNVNFSPTPTIYERELTAQADLQKEAQLGRGNVMIVPQSQQDMVPLTKMGERTTWNYKSESGHPSLLPMGSLRGAPPEFATHNEGWETQYGTLYDALPDELKAMLAQDPTLSATLAAVMEVAAKVLNGQVEAGKYIDTENALNRTEANTHFPQNVFGYSSLTTKELIDIANNYLESVGPNDPDYVAMKDFILQTGSLLNEVNPK